MIRRSREWERGERVGCLFCSFEAATEEENHQHIREKHSGVMEREDELMASFRRGEITAREVRETLQEEFV